jgi:hypothetical protein
MAWYIIRGERAHRDWEPIKLNSLKLVKSVFKLAKLLFYFNFGTNFGDPNKVARTDLL